MKYDELEKKIDIVCEEEGVSKSDIFCIPDRSIVKEISQVEKYLGLKLPDSYKWFLETYGSGGMDTFDFFGIESDREDISLYTVVYATDDYRKKGMKKELVVIQDYGDYVKCIDTSKCNENNESPIVNWSCYDNGDIDFVSDAFINYFWEILEDLV